MKIVRKLLIVVGVLLLVSVTTATCGGTGRGGTTAEGEPPRRHLLIVLDGLRPDYVTPELMPNLHALGQRGVVMTRHHAVYPTVTRVNASSISTGEIFSPLRLMSSLMRPTRYRHSLSSR